jgi:hypothetical protein
MAACSTSVADLAEPIAGPPTEATLDELRAEPT